MSSDFKLKPEEKKILTQFKASVSDLIKPEDDDEALSRWLKARSWDLKKAEKMFRDSVDWRKKYGTDQILDWQMPEVLSKYNPGGWFGHDKLGHPIWWELLGFTDVKGMIQSTTKKDLIKSRIYLTEYVRKKLFPEVSKKFGRKITKTVYIFDMEGLGLKHIYRPAAEIYLELLQIVEANYPETLHTGYVINVPGFFNVAYGLVKPFIAEETRSKLKVLGRDWKESLLKVIDADQLPVYWGGTATDPDGEIHCRSQICIGGPIPESYYLKNVISSMDLEKFTKISINQGSSIQLDYEVKQPGSVISYNFWTDNKDIGFAIYRRKTDKKEKTEEMIKLVEPSRVNCQMAPDCGIVQCDNIGTYVVEFDNTYSWMNPKKVSYLIEVLVPDLSGSELERIDSTDM